MCSIDLQPSASWEITRWLFFFKCLPCTSHLPKCFSYKSLLKGKCHSTFPFLMFGINAPLHLSLCTLPQFPLHRWRWNYTPRILALLSAFTLSTFTASMDNPVHTQWLQLPPTYTTFKSMSLVSDIQLVLSKSSLNQSKL